MNKKIDQLIAKNLGAGFSKVAMTDEQREMQQKIINARYGI